ncbi:glycerophosphodiester phosphodiesterase [Sphingomonas xinjiangensis]|nr:glycerophosphodiester phosphodiesterase [Sphingomonas xinjiangensis]
MLAQSPAAAQDRPMTATTQPIVIAHRGASGERPEHTSLSYELAIDQGADFIEPDLVPTKDGVLVARHENNIADTTDVAAHPEFAARKTTKTIDGQQVTGWFTEDFTLAELKTLRAKERLPQLRPGNQRYDGQAQILTLAEVIAIAKQGTRRTGRTIGIYPETKHPSYFASIGLPLEARLVAGLEQAGWNRADAPVFIQSFEVKNLQQLKGMTPVRLIQLMAPAGTPADGGPSYASMSTAQGLSAIAAYAHGIGPELTMVVSASTRYSTLIADAHAAGLKIHPWTFRAENYFLPPPYRSQGTPAAHGNLDAMIQYFIGLGVDGFFTDYPALGVSARSSAKAARPS